MSASRPRRLLFVCVANSFRSQIAEGFARALARPGSVDVRSGGTNPSGIVHSGAIRIMGEVGVDIAGQRSKPIDLAFADHADAFVSLCGPLDGECPARLAKKALDWSLSDPSWSTPDDQRAIRDAIREKVVRLLSEWNVLSEEAR